MSLISLIAYGSADMYLLGGISRIYVYASYITDTWTFIKRHLSKRTVPNDLKLLKKVIIIEKKLNIILSIKKINYLILVLAPIAQ